MEKMQGLTPRQIACREAIENFFRENKCAPTYIELGKALGITCVSAANLVARLESRGHLIRTRGAARSLTLVPMAA